MKVVSSPTLELMPNICEKEQLRLACRAERIETNKAILVNTVTFIRVSTVDNVIQQAKTQAMVLPAKESDILLAAWTGQWSQDIFHLDNRVELLRIFS